MLEKKAIKTQKRRAQALEKREEDKVCKKMNVWALLYFVLVRDIADGVHRKRALKCTDCDK